MRLPAIRFRQSSTPAITAANVQITHLSRTNNLPAALHLFDSMPERTVVSWNSLIAAYFHHRQPHLAELLFHRTPQKDTATYNAMISGYVKNHKLHQARALFDSMPARNVTSWTSIIRGYTQSNNLPEALTLFHKMPERNVVTYTVMITGLISSGRIDDAVRLFDDMPEKDVVARTAMIVGLFRAGRTDHARELFDAMPKRNVVTWTAMVSGYVRCMDVERAREVFDAMPERNEVTWTAMITGYIQAGRIDDAVQLFKCMPIKSLATCNAMILGFGQSGMVGEAREMFGRMRERDEGSWSAMMKVFERNGCEIEALDVFRSMQMARVDLNFPSVISALTVCASLAILDHGTQAHAALLKSHFDSDVFVMSALITMYVKCGDLAKARRVFDMFGAKDVVMWNSMISGYAQHGLGEDALCVFDKMQSAGMVPDEITLIGVLLACSYTGMVEKGREIFDSMGSKWLIEPKAEHYACMVDLLGRAGNINEAMDMIRNMPIEADAVIWGALLGACKTHKNLEIAEIAAKKLLHLEPHNSGHYVALSNIYASSGRFDDVGKVRKAMSTRKVRKFPGCSWVEIEKKLYMFTGVELIHPDHVMINGLLEKLDGLLKDAGYCPDGSFVLHDVDEEQKSHNLRYHSERQALALGILKVPKGMPIRIMKNLSVCGDCHSAIKLISKIMDREVILRDPSRFHHFKDGSCSCRDYW